MPVTLVVNLWVQADREGDFVAYEDDALALIREHGGRVLRRVRRVEPGDHLHPFETHIVDFPDEPSFARFEADPRRAAMAERRAACVAKTTVWRVADVT